MSEREGLFPHRLPPDLAARLDAFLAAERARLAPATLPRRAVINAALRAFLDARADAPEEVAAPAAPAGAAGGRRQRRAANTTAGSPATAGPRRKRAAAR